MQALLDSPYLMPAAGGLVALLGVAGLFYVRRRNGQMSSETSFLESKVEPDSFFGASGGQRVDTSDGPSSGSAQSSSLNYSLSQLDAIGDVDPVAEADVYLAYGRDLQAEEILKEAMRSDPSRLAIRLKLLEVYAKRADTKAFELHAKDLFAQTGGAGDEWARAQEMGRQVDPGNPLYREGVQSADLKAAAAAAGDDDGESTLLATVPQRDRGAPTTMLQPETVARDLDLDLDLSETPAPSADVTQPLNAGDSVLPDLTLDDLPGAANAPAVVVPAGPDLDLPDLGAPPAPPAPAPAPAPSFDFGELSLDLDPPAPAAAPAAAAPAPAPAPQPGVDDLPDLAAAPAGVQADDPLARKLELADEFRRIGDMEGARDLLEEVISRADGAMKARAQAMLKDLA